MCVIATRYVKDELWRSAACAPCADHHVKRINDRSVINYPGTGDGINGFLSRFYVRVNGGGAVLFWPLRKNVRDAQTSCIICSHMDCTTMTLSS